MAQTSLAYDSAESQIVMKEILDTNIGMQFEEEAPFSSLFPFGDQKYVHELGAQWVDDMEPSPGFRGMGATQRAFGEGSRPGRARFTITFAELAHTSRIHGRTLYTDKESLINGWRYQVERATNTFIKQVEFEMHGDGSGRLATLNGTPASGAMALTRPYGGAQLLRRGRYNIVDPAAGTKRTITFTTGTETVNSFFVNSKTGGYTVNWGKSEAATAAAADAIDSTTAVDGDIVVWRDHWGLAIKGLAYYVSNAVRTVANQSSANYPQLNSVIVPAGNSPLTTKWLDLVEYGMIDRQGKVEGLNGLFWVMPTAQHAAYRSLGYNLPTQIIKRAGMNDRKLDLGWEVVEHNGRTFMICPDADPSKMTMLNRSTWRRFGAKAPSVVQDREGSILNPTYEASTGNLLWEYTFNLNMLSEFNCRYPFKNGAVTGLSYDGLPLKADVITY